MLDPDADAADQDRGKMRPIASDRLDVVSAAPAGFGT
jgi:hypothetical protein